ncbi:hypothetical protein GOODEAATRI_025675 [Goodea atripinnis]|uniref:Uncharacterized protein n=1 Tax=Goodea atripinnis TaxID=208336 RepID=A0ABV0N498_9TELE
MFCQTKPEGRLQSEKYYLSQVQNPDKLHMRCLTMQQLIGDIFPCHLSPFPLFLLRFLIGNKSDLRDASRTDCQVSQELAMNLAKAHGMVFFETSAKNPPKKHINGRRGEREDLFQQSKVEDIVTAVGTTLKKHKTPLTAYSPAYSGSFKIYKKKQEKELWTCC